MVGMKKDCALQVLESQILSQRHKLGYMFSKPRHSEYPDHSRLDIMLRPTPTNMHFDPKQVYFMILEDEDLELLKITYTGLPQNKYRVVAGLIRIQDRKGKVVFAFTFGGDLQIEMEEEEKICTLISTAPILQFNRPTTIRFIEEVEIFLAVRRAEWGSNYHEFEARLAAVEPLILYTACLDYLTEKSKDSFHEDSLDLQHYLRKKSRAIHKEYKGPDYSLSLRELI